MSTSLALDSTLGAMFIGFVIATALYGLTVLQTWYYYMHQPRDLWPTKYLVAAVAVSDTLHQIAISITMYGYLITNWGRPDRLNVLPWYMALEVLFNCTTAFLVQSFMVHRVWLLSNGKIVLMVILALFVLAEFTLSLVFTGLTFTYNTYASLVALKPLSLSINIVTAVGDVLIAGSLCVLLHSSRTGFSRSDTLINRLILFTVNTGLLTSVCAVASFISYMAFPQTFVYITFYFCIGRLYTNALLATLNVRTKFRSGFERNSVSVSLHGLSNNPSDAKNDISIKIDTTKEVVGDESDTYLQSTHGSIPSV